MVKFIFFLHVGVLVGGDLGAVGEVDLGPLVERAVDILLVDVLDHWLSNTKSN